MYEHSDIPAWYSDDEETVPRNRRRVHHARDRVKIVNHVDSSTLGYPEHQKRNSGLLDKELNAFHDQLNKEEKESPKKQSQGLQSQTLNFYSSGAQAQITQSLYDIKSQDKNYTGIGNPRYTASEGVMKRGLKRINQSFRKNADTLFKMRKQPNNTASLANVLNMMPEEEKHVRCNSVELEEFYSHHCSIGDYAIPQDEEVEKIGKLALSLIEGRALSSIYDPTSTNSLRGDVTYLMYCDLLVEGQKKRSKAKLARRALPNAQQAKGIPTPIVKWDESYEFDLTNEDSMLYIETFQLPASTTASGRKLSTGNRVKKSDPIFSGYISVPLTQFQHGNAIDGWYTLLSEMGEPTHGSLHLNIQVKIEEEVTTPEESDTPVEGEEKHVESQQEQQLVVEPAIESPVDTFTNKFAEFGMDMEQKMVAEMERMKTKFRTKTRSLDKREQQLELQVRKLSGMLRILDQENLYLRTRVTAYEDELSLNNQRLSHLEEHIDHMANKQEWRAQQLILLLVSYFLGFLGLVILGISVICKKMGKPHVVDGVYQRLNEKRKKLENLAKHRFTVMTITPVRNRRSTSSDSDHDFVDCDDESEREAFPPMDQNTELNEATSSDDNESM
jgi:hypothetical protein